MLQPLCVQCFIIAARMDLGQFTDPASKAVSPSVPLGPSSRHRADGDRAGGPFQGPQIHKPRAAPSS